MNKVILTLGLIISTSLSFSQFDSTQINEHKMKFGFNLGMNLTNIYTKGLPNQGYTEGGFGFRLGVLADIKINRLMSISPRAELSFNAATVHFPSLDPVNPVSPYRIMQNSIELAPLFKIRMRDKKLMPYFVFGPNIKVPIRYNQSQNSTAVFTNNADVAIDAGFGIEKGFGRVFSSLEVKYSLGLVNINHHPSLQSVKLHNISLVWNFVG